VTRGVQEVVLDKSIRLLDSPGIIFSAESDAAAVLRNAVKVERLADPLAPVAVILERVPKKQLMAVYKVGVGWVGWEQVGRGERVRIGCCGGL
jgi:nuclear GTP-binding protein